jgi:hypothetical protein
MSDHELLARADKVMAFPWVDGEVYDVIRDLRAALATRPEPLFEGTWGEFNDWRHTLRSVPECHVTVTAIEPAPETLARPHPDFEFVKPEAAAGSATPTQETDDE